MWRGLGQLWRVSSPRDEREWAKPTGQTSQRFGGGVGFGEDALGKLIWVSGDAVEMVEPDESESWELEWLPEPRGGLRLRVCMG